MTYPYKSLNEMSPDEIAALTPEDFKELAGDHNDQVEQRENAHNQKVLASIDPFTLASEIRVLEYSGNKPDRLEILGAERERRLESFRDSEDAAYLLQEYRDSENQAPWTPGLNENGPGLEHTGHAAEDLDGPDNPLNYPDQRKLMETDQRLTPEQQEAVRNHDKDPLTVSQQLSILKALEKPSGGYGDGRPLPYEPLAEANNPFNFPEARKLMETDERLTPEQRVAVHTHSIEPLSTEQQKAILDTLDQTMKAYTSRDQEGPEWKFGSLLNYGYSYGMGQDHSDLPSPDKEVDELLDKLVEERASERFGKPLIPAVIEAVKELPEAVRKKMNPFRPMLKWDHEDDQERENTLRNGRW